MERKMDGKTIKLRASCNGCNESKVRCSQHKPTCSRCERNRIECVYGLSRRTHRDAPPISVSSASSQRPRLRGRSYSASSTGRSPSSTSSNNPNYNNNDAITTSNSSTAGNNATNPTANNNKKNNRDAGTAARATGKTGTTETITTSLYGDVGDVGDIMGDMVEMDVDNFISANTMSWPSDFDMSVVSPPQQQQEQQGQTGGTTAQFQLYQPPNRLGSEMLLDFNPLITTTSSLGGGAPSAGVVSPGFATKPTPWGSTSLLSSGTNSGAQTPSTETINMSAASSAYMEQQQRMMHFAMAATRQQSLSSSSSSSADRFSPDQQQQQCTCHAGVTQLLAAMRSSSSSSSCRGRRGSASSSSDTTRRHDHDHTGNLSPSPSLDAQLAKLKRCITSAETSLSCTHYNYYPPRKGDGDGGGSGAADREPIHIMAVATLIGYVIDEFEMLATESPLLKRKRTNSTLSSEQLTYGESSMLSSSSTDKTMIMTGGSNTTNSSGGSSTSSVSPGSSEDSSCIIARGGSDHSTATTTTSGKKKRSHHRHKPSSRHGITWAATAEDEDEEVDLRQKLYLLSFRKLERLLVQLTLCLRTLWDQARAAQAASAGSGVVDPSSAARHMAFVMAADYTRLWLENKAEDVKRHHFLFSSAPAWSS